MSKITLENLSINFRAYHDCSPSLKEYFSTIFKKKEIDSYSEFHALRNISLEINEGERVGIIGHNGAGKSTLLKAICKIYEPSEGYLHVDGKIAPLLEIGAGFHPEFTGRENIYLNGTILGYDSEQIAEIEFEVIQFAELEEFIDTPVKYYSTGMYLRLAFSVATAIHPEILILDEVFAGGDAGFVEKATKRMEEIIDKSSIMLLVSHDLMLLEKYCNRIIWIDHGRVKKDGGTHLVFDAYQND